MKLISWNVGGIGSRVKDGTLQQIFDMQPDIFCIQELKQKAKTFDETLYYKEVYESYFYPAVSDTSNWGVGTYSKITPTCIRYGLGDYKLDKEGRIQKFEFEHFNLFNVYFPSGSDSERKPIKYKFYKHFTKYVNKSKKPQVICGDFNRVAADMDDFDIEQHKYNMGSRKDEREWFHDFLESGFIDSFRIFNQERDNYTYWSSKDKKNENKGYRFDYFLVNEQLKDNVVDASILRHVVTHDHAPITLELEF